MSPTAYNLPLDLTSWAKSPFCRQWERISKGEGIIVASLIELGEVKEESEDLFTFGDDETLSASALRASHEPPLVNGRICFSKDVRVDRF